jgi:hypothetical protein
MTQPDTQTLEETTVSEPTSQQVVRKTKVIIPQAGSETPRQDYQTKKVIFRTYQIIWYILGIVEVLLTFRFLLKIFGADSGTGFTSFIYSISNPFAQPFAGIFGVSSTSGMVFEWSTLVAMAVYAIVAYGLVKLFQLIKPTNQQEVSDSVDNQ